MPDVGFENSLSFKYCGQWVPGFSEIKLLVFQHFFCSPVLVEVIDTHYLYLIWK